MVSSPLRYVLPALPLRRYISCYYIFDLPLEQMDDVLLPELANIRFCLRGGWTAMLPGSPPSPCPRAMLVGMRTKPLAIRAHGPIRLMGVGLLPAGWHALFGVDASELADGIHDLRDIIGADADRALWRMMEARDDGALAAAADDLFLAMARQSRRESPWFIDAVDNWLVGAGNSSVDGLAARLDLSTRQVERLINGVYGCSPKRLVRKYRFLRAVSVMVNDADSRWLDAAGDDFYDQSHFIRDFKAFSGMTPGQFMAQNAAIARVTMTLKRSLPGLSPLALIS
jgi:AraC-like DNA-binding protein